MTGIHFEVYKDIAGEWRWRMIDGNNRIVGTSGESYTRPQDAERGMRNVVGDIRSITNPEIPCRVVG